MGEIVDGQYQKYAVESGAYVRQHFWGADPRLLEMVKHLSDDQLKKLTLGGHDPVKVYNAYKAAVEHKGAPTVILARTIKGYGLGEAGEGKNITHQQKKMNEEELRAFRTRFGIPISDAEIHDAPFYRPAEDAIEIKYMREQRQALGGYLPEPQGSLDSRSPRCPHELFEEFHKGTEGRKASTTMVFVRLLSKLLRDKQIRPAGGADRARRGADLRHGGAVPAGRHLLARRARSTSRSTWTCSSITRKRPTARFSKKASPKPGRCRRSSPPARRTRRTA